MKRLWGERVIQLCLVQVLDYEAQQYRKKKRVLECAKCPVRESCAKWVKEKNENTNKNQSTMVGNERH